MWFDPHARLAELEGEEMSCTRRTFATSATIATQARIDGPRVAEVADLGVLRPVVQVAHGLASARRGILCPDDGGHPNGVVVFHPCTGHRPKFPVKTQSLQLPVTSDPS